MNDEDVQSKSEEKEVIADEVDNDVSDDQMVPKSRLDKVIEQREQAQDELSSLKEKIEDIDTLKTELAELRESVSQKKNESDDGFTREEEDALAKIDRGLKAKGYLTKEELDERDRISNRNNQIDKLSSKYTKGSGFPVFKADEVLVYAKKMGFGNNLEAAYRDMHWDAITQVIAKRQGEGFEPVNSEKPIGGERQTGTELTTSAVAEMDDSEYEKNRSTILGKFRKSIFGK